jgi:hypothetical protein
MGMRNGNKTKYGQQVSKNDLSLEIFNTQYSLLNYKDKELIKNENQIINKKKNVEFENKSLLQLAGNLNIPLMIEKS